MADINIRFTRRMTGASPPCFSSEDTSICSISSSISTSSSMTPAVSSRARVTMSRVAALLRFAACCWTTSRFFFGSWERRGVVARHELDVVHGEHVGRIRHRDRQRRAGAAQRNDLVLLRGLGGDQLDDRRIDLELRQVDRGHAVLLREQGRDLLVLDEAKIDEIKTELPAARLLIVQRLLQLRR